MQIAFVEFSPSGGLFQFTFQLADRLAASGHDVELVTGPRPEMQSRTPGFEVRSILPTWHNGSSGVDSLLWHRVRRVTRAARHIAALGAVVAYVLRRRPDVVFWPPLRFPVDAWCVLLVDRLTSTRSASIVHETKALAEQPGTEGLYRSSRLLESAVARAYRVMDATFVLSETNRDYVRSTWQPSGSVTVIPHGDESVFLEGGEPTPAEDTPPHVLFFGTWTQHKGIDVLLSAFELVRVRVPDARLTMAGAIANVDFEKIRTRSDEVGGVRLRPGYVPMAEAAELMQTHRVVAVPYLRANQSGVVHLAQTFGRASVATRVGDIPDAVVDEITGILVEPGDAASLADGLVRLLQDAGTAGRMGRAAAAQVRDVGSWDAIAAKVHAALVDDLA